AAHPHEEKEDHRAKRHHGSLLLSRPKPSPRSMLSRLSAPGGRGGAPESRFPLQAGPWGLRSSLTPIGVLFALVPSPCGRGAPCTRAGVGASAHLDRLLDEPDAAAPDAQGKDAAPGDHQRERLRGDAAQAALEEDRRLVAIEPAAPAHEVPHLATP